VSQAAALLFGETAQDFNDHFRGSRWITSRRVESVTGTQLCQMNSVKISNIWGSHELSQPGNSAPLSSGNILKREQFLKELECGTEASPSAPQPYWVFWPSLFRSSVARFMMPQYGDLAKVQSLLKGSPH
jgi:hypothetical protein